MTNTAQKIKEDSVLFEADDSFFDLRPLSAILSEDQTPRWYQTETAHDVYRYLKEGFKRILIVLPTGAGKTLTSKIIAVHPMIREALGVPNGQKLRLLFLSHLHTLLDQAERIYDEKTNVEFIRQSAFRDLPEDVMREGWDLCVIDEAHHEAMMSIQYRLAQLKDKPIIGMTATPDRGDGLLLKFERRICKITRKQAVEQGFLAKTDLNTILDFGGTNKVEILSRLMHNYGHEMGKTIAFLRTKKEVMAVHEAAIMAGKKSVALLNQSENELKRLLAAFSSGEVDFIANCARISEGVDVVGCDNIILGKQFQSYNELNQAIGRGARPDSPCNLWQLSNPNRKMLNAEKIVGTPSSHRLIEMYNGYCEESNFNLAA